MNAALVRDRALGFGGLELDAQAAQKGALGEAKLDKGKGPVASVLVTDGTLITGDEQEPDVEDLRTEYSGHPFEPEIEHFLRCIIDDTEPLIDACAGANSAAPTILAAESVAAGGRPMEVPYFAR